MESQRRDPKSRNRLIARLFSDDVSDLNNVGTPSQRKWAGLNKNFSAKFGSKVRGG
jgi:hypothetical protein